MADRSSSTAIAGLLEKMKSADPDFRYMALNDLISRVRDDTAFVAMDEGTESRVVAQVLDMMKDANGEVKNMTVKT